MLRHFLIIWFATILSLTALQAHAANDELMQAAFQGDLSRLKSLLDAGVSVETSAGSNRIYSER